MLRPLLRAIAAFAFAVFIMPASPSAAPAPGLSYDEIVRVIVNATPPPPGNFQADLAAVVAANAATPTPAPRRRTGIGNIVGNILTGNVGGAVTEAATQSMLDNMAQSIGAQFSAFGAMMSSFLTPHLMHYAYWNGWERVDDVSAQTATIRKCDAGQVIRLDLAGKTYQIYDPSAEPLPTAPPASVHRGRAAPPDPGQPGTATVTLSETTRSLGLQRIENQNAAGYDTTTTFAMTQSTGSCRDANASFYAQQYLATVARPTVNACPIRRPPLPTTATEVVTAPSGGCRPTFTARRSGPTVPGNRLALYSLITFSAGSASATPAPQGATPGVGFLTERGNLRTLGPGDAGLFAIPPGFTRQP